MTVFSEQSVLLVAHTLAVALSIFNVVAFLWLACTVWLNGDRRSMIARVGVVGLGLSALFFFVHALLTASPFAHNSGLVTADFLWRLSWLPGLGAPYIWFVIGLHYASLMNEKWRRRRPWLLLGSGLLGCIVLLILILNRNVFTFMGTIRLLAYSALPTRAQTDFLPVVISLPILFLCYLTFCAIGPWFTPNRVRRALLVLCRALVKRRSFASLRQALIDAFSDDHARAALLEEPVFSWHLARPILLVAALVMVGLTTTLGVIGVWSTLNWFDTAIVPPPELPAHALGAIPLHLMLIDIVGTGAVAVILLLIGYSIVQHGILIERPLARRGFFEQWRGIVIVATVIAIFIAVFVAVTHSNLSGLLLITCVTTGIYALFTWSNYTAHDRYIAMLGPFLRSSNVHHWLKTDLQKTEQNMEALFFHLCRDVLDIQYARLDVLAGPIKPSFTYLWSMKAQVEEHTQQVLRRRVHAYRIRVTMHGMRSICWVLPIYDELGLVAKLYLGPRAGGAGLTDEDMEIAQACGQRILDTLRDHEAMQAVAGLLRRRIVDVKLLGGQQRRILHDEILPQMHLALLRLETLRLFVRGKQDPAQASSALGDAIEMISDSHRRLASMMREMATGAPYRLEREGLMQAIQTMIEHDFHQAFDAVHWEVSEETALRIDELVPPAIAELLFAAVQEALRNAARHGRGTDVHRRLCLTLSASCNPDLEIVVHDDGVGMKPAGPTSGTGGGLMTHSALLTIAGGNLVIKSAPDEGVTVHIQLPEKALR
ncbi:sensor histidine kinase [Thermosporothrix hazakensis]|jgi:signal transduction histidine kinase|nr:ATP-binding protein [Thermosporothrix hazakensis]